MPLPGEEGSWAMVHEKSPTDRLLDVLVFGPAGLALSAAEEFPKLVEKGRHHIDGRIRTARLIGQVAVQMGQRQLDQLITQWATPSASTPTTSPPTASPPTASPAPASPLDAPPEAPSPASAPTLVAVPDEAAAAPEVAPPAGDAVTPANGHGPVRPLAIPGYDSLSASQVVQRLGGLSRAELIDVRTYESSARHRRTILHRVEQLLAGDSAPRP